MASTLLSYHIAKDASGGECALLLHGFLGSGRNLRGLARRLLDDGVYGSVIIIDHLGHGDSPALPARPTLAHLADAMWRLMDHLVAAGELRDAGGAHLIGHSLGGRVALSMRLRRPQTLFPITLIDIAPGTVRTLRGDLDRVFSAFLACPDRVGERAEMADFLRRQGIAPPLVQWLLLNLKRDAQGFSWNVDRSALKTLHENSGDTDLWWAVEGGGRAELTRCIRGGASAFVSDEAVARLRGHGVPVLTIAGAGHSVHVDALEELVAAIAEFPRPT